jgi:GNAT superfamily N-acetyltransferase
MSAKDIGYIAKSWKETLYQAGMHPSLDCPWRHKSKSVFYSRVNAPIDALLANSITDVVLDPIDRSYIVGWCCYSADAVHYVYVREALRRLGIGAALLERAGIAKRSDVTHWATSVEARHILDKHSCIYRPELAYSKRAQNEVTASQNSGTGVDSGANDQTIRGE